MQAYFAMIISYRCKLFIASAKDLVPFVSTVGKSYKSGSRAAKQQKKTKEREHLAMS
jgi:hypothetical protein